MLITVRFLIGLFAKPPEGGTPNITKPPEGGTPNRTKPLIGRAGENACKMGTGFKNCNYSATDLHR